MKRSRLATKVSMLMAGVLGLALLSSGTALWTSWRIERSMRQDIQRDMTSLRAAQEVNIALLEQRGFISSFIVSDGGRSWLDALQPHEIAFMNGLERARQTSRTPREHELLAEVERVYRSYDARREQVVQLYESGSHDEARDVLLNDVKQLYEEARDLCQAFMSANEQYIASTMRRARKQTDRTMVVVATLAALTVGMTVALLWLFFQDILFPLRRMVSEVRTFTGQDEELRPGEEDELAAIGGSLRALMLDVQDTRSTLQHSRRQLVQNEKLASVGKLAASVAHEIRNPLTAMKMWLYSLRKTANDLQVQHKFDLVSDEMDRLERIVQHFLEFSRPPVVNLQPVNVAGLIDKTFELLAPRLQQADVIVHRAVEPNLPQVHADPQQLKQVLLNLIGNAVEATDSRGPVTVSAADGTDVAGGRAVVIRVRDSGPGMPADVRARIFEPFFTTKETGTGLGLCIAAQIIARHEGRLVLEESDERGSCFAIWLPLKEQRHDEQHPDRR